ncbi:MAG TPA: hypothetical protein VIH71_08365 [Solirubrobacteraceae bacterium]
MIAAHCRSNRLGQLVVGELLQHKPLGARGERVLGERQAIVHRQDHYLRVGRIPAQRADQLNARAAADAQIEHQHVRLVQMHLMSRRSHVICFGDHFHV